MIATNFAQ